MCARSATRWRRVAQDNAVPARLRLAAPLGDVECAIAAPLGGVEWHYRRTEPLDRPSTRPHHTRARIPRHKAITLLYLTVSLAFAL